MASDTKDTGSEKLGESGGEALKTLLNARNVAPTDDWRRPALACTCEAGLGGDHTPGCMLYEAPAQKQEYETPKLRELAGEDLAAAKAAIPAVCPNCGMAPPFHSAICPRVPELVRELREETPRPPRGHAARMILGPNPDFDIPAEITDPVDDHGSDPLVGRRMDSADVEDLPAPVDLPPPDVTPRVPDPEDLDLKEHPIKTVGRPLSELPRCSVCDKYVGSIFRVVDLHMGLVDQKAARQVAGIAFGFGFPLPLAEMFSSHGDAVRITDDPRIDDRGYLCLDCFAASDLPLLQEKIHRAIDRAKAARG